MNKLYNTQSSFATNISSFLSDVVPNIRKSQLNIIPFISLGMILSHSVVSSDIAKSLKDDFSLVQFDSVTRRIRRLFSNNLFDPYSFYEHIIKFVISNYKKKHSDNRVHIVFDHMYSKDNYTILLFSLRVGKQGIPIYFRCFKGIRNKSAFIDDTIIDAISSVVSYFNDSNLNLIFLADRWFNSKRVFNHLISLNVSFCIRLKSDLNIAYFNKKEGHYIRSHPGLLPSTFHHAKYFPDTYLFDDLSTKVNIVISPRKDVNEPWIIATNSDVTRAIKDYSYRFGAIESLFKNQKSNGFRLENVSNSSLKSFTSMFAILCFSYLFITILGADYSKNIACYKHVKITTHKKYNGIKRRVMSLFKTGLTLFHLAFNSIRYIRIPMKFILYDI